MHAIAEAAHSIPALPEIRLIGVRAEACALEGRRMSYIEAGAGNGQAVFLLHGIGSNATGWRYVIDGLKDRYRVIAWNAPGYYLSDNLREEAPTNVHYADAVAALLDALGIESAHFAGSSFGSLIAASFAARHPARVRRLALFGASRGQKSLPQEERAQRLRMREESVRDGGIGLAESRWKNLVSDMASPTAIRLTQEVLKATHRRGLMQAARASDTTDVLEFAGAIAAPTLLVVGTEDRVNPPEISRAIHAAISGSRLVELERVGHMPKLEAPDRVVALLGEHFAADRRMP